MLIRSIALEFRNQSWFSKDVYKLLEKHNVCLCFSDSPDFARTDAVTADFAYFRYHGRSQLYASNYTKQQLRAEAKKIGHLADQGLDIFAYFNNDAHAYAISNAYTLKQLLDLAA